MTRALAFAIVLLCGPSFADERLRDPFFKPWWATEMPSTFKLEPSRYINFGGQDSKMLMKIDMKERRIIVAEDVDVDDAARQVIKAMEGYLQQMCPR